MSDKKGYKRKRYSEASDDDVQFKHNLHHGEHGTLQGSEKQGTRQGKNCDHMLASSDHVENNSIDNAKRNCKQVLIGVCDDNTQIAGTQVTRVK